jgi:hypothetical protein
MRKTCYFMFGALMLASMLRPATAQDKPGETRTLKVKVHYTGSGTVDDKHRILVFLFDTPAFVDGTAIPIGSESATSKKEVVTFTDIAKSPVYVTTVYDPSGAYQGMSAPPSGSSLGMYSKTPGKPAPVELKEGKAPEVTITFDDSEKMP